MFGNTVSLRQLYLLVKDKTPGGNVSDVDTRNWENDNNKQNFAEIFPLFDRMVSTTSPK